jgi:hypothetical protein
MKNRAKKTHLFPCSKGYLAFWTLPAPLAGIITLAGICLMLAVTACPSPVDPEQKTVRYAITVKDSAHGTVSAGRETAGAGENITLNIVPDTGYRLSSIRVTGSWEITLNGSGNTRTFIMPAEDVLVAAAFAKVESNGHSKYRITINEMTGGRFESSPADFQYEGDTVQLTAQPAPGQKYRPGSLTVSGANSRKAVKISPVEDSDMEWIFEMPAEDVEIDASFIDDSTVLYSISVIQTANGSIECGQDSAVPGDTVTVVLLPQDEDYRYRAGSLTITPKLDLTDISESADNGSRTWIFTMPEEPVSITAAFEEIPAYAVTVPDWGENGAITVSSVNGPDTVREGSPVTLTLDITDNVNYRYVKYSLVITGTDSGGRIDFEPDGELQWIFIMPAEAVTVEAAIEFIPYYDILIAENVRNGRLTISGVETEGVYAGKAREGAAITVTAAPDSGYKLADNSLFVLPQGVAALTKLEGQAAWTFEMADTDLEIGVIFDELGPLEIYKGGARRGITASELADDKKYYANSIIMESGEGGHNGNQQAIKVTPAINANGNAVQQSFGLFSAAEIDLDTVVALSFWAKANKNLNVRYAGFGDADPDKRVVYTGEGFNHQIALSSAWKRYVIPVPAFSGGLKTTRVFFMNVQLAIGNYIYIDDIEFIESGVTLTGITIPETCNLLLYGETNAAKMLKGAPLKLNYACPDGITVTLQCADSSSNHTFKDNLAHWLTPFIQVNGNVTFSEGVIIPQEKSAAFTLTVNMAGKTSNPMAARIFDGILLDDFEDLMKDNIPSNPASTKGYLWYTNMSTTTSTVMIREYYNVDNKEIHSGLGAGSWRPAATANKPRGGRNFDSKNAAGCTTLVFWIKVATGANLIPQRNTVFTFELRNNGTLTSKTDGPFFTRQFTYDADDWQEVRMPLADFIEAGLDISAITGYAFGVVDNQGTALKIMLDDIALVKD